MIDSLSQLQKKLIANGHKVFENHHWYMTTSLGEFSIVSGELIRDNKVMTKEELKQFKILLNEKD